MKFQPKTEKQIAEESLLPVGTYSFQVVEAKEAVSKGGNDMIVLKNQIYRDDGSPSLMVDDYLVSSIAYKLRHAADACGLIAEYESGELQALDFEGKSGQLKLRIQKDKEGKYPDKNVVGDYIKLSTDGNDGPPAGHPASEAPPHDPDMPF